ncbi:MAG: NUDIX domain-containing protein [Woeseiaceae bacterium]|nr:NUDIX domain-containing protein [Woeseiaceae bacterium]
MYPTDLTVAAVVERDGRYLLVEEHAMGLVVLSQPGGHIEAGESPEQAVVREVLEETGCTVECGELIGVYLWIHPQTRQQFLRLVYVAEFVSCDESLPLDHSIVSRQWLSRAELEGRRNSLRSPAVLRCVDDYEAGRREGDALIASLFPLANHVDRVLARAELV